MMADGDFIGPWKEGEPRVSRIVFIGRNLNRPQLRRGFEAARSPRERHGRRRPFLLDTRGVSQRARRLRGRRRLRSRRHDAAFALGDGTLRLLAPASATGAPSRRMTAPSLALSPPMPPPTGFVTGGDDGKFRRMARDGSVATSPTSA